MIQILSCKDAYCTCKGHGGGVELKQWKDHSFEYRGTMECIKFRNIPEKIKIMAARWWLLLLAITKYNENEEKAGVGRGSMK